MKNISKSRTLIFIIWFLSLSVFASDKKTIALLGQYHLSGKTITTDIESSKKLPQYNNQKAIYLVLDEWVRTNKLNLLISEGCEGEIDKSYKASFNGWSYSSLKEMKDNKKYEDVLSLVPLKIEAKYDDSIKTICGDNQKLIEQHQLIFSDLKGYLGFYSRLKQSGVGSKMYQAYLKALEESEKIKIERPLSYLKAKAIKLLDQEQALLLKRNESFLKVIRNSKAKVIALVIGDRHIKGLKVSLEKDGHQVLLFDIVQETIPKVGLHEKLKAILGQP